MNKWQRVQAALHGDPVDRTPLSLWKHYHLQDRAPGRLAELTVQFHRQFDTDLIKLTPSGLYSVQDWGVTICFGLDDDTFPAVVQPAVTSPAGWRALPRLDPGKGALGRELETIHRTAALLAGSAPFIMTIFSPLTAAYKLGGSAMPGNPLFDHLRDDPRALHAGLQTIADVTLDYAVACLEAGASGIFYATQLASDDLLSRQEYAEFGVPYDLRVLEGLAGKSPITMLHVCGEHLMFELLTVYPVDVINWADRESGPGLAEARRLTRRPLAGGLALGTLLSGTVDQVNAEVCEALAQAGPEGFMLAPACVIEGGTPEANLLAARRALDDLGRSGR